MKKTRGVYEKNPGSGEWWIQYFDSRDRRRREKVGTKAAAIRLVEKRRTEAREGVKLPDNLRAKAVTFRELADEAIIWSRAHKKSWDDDEFRLKSLLPEFGDKAAEQITAGDIRKWLDSKASELTLATRNRYCALVKMIYRVGEENERIKINPARLVHQKKENNGRIRYMTDAEEAKLRGVISCSHLPQFEIGLQTGMRLSEQFGLTWDQVDIDGGIIRLPETKHGDGRFVRLNSRARTVLRMLHESRVDDGLVFAGNRVPRWFTDQVRKGRRTLVGACGRAGITGITWHTLRHTYISRLVMAGVDLRTVMELAGHKTIQMTMRYAHLAPGHAALAVEKLCEPSATSTATSESGAVVVVQ